MPVAKNLSNVNVGITANDGTGDLLRDAFVKVNNNLNSLYTGGQFVGHGPDDRNFPSFTWSEEKNTGIYKPKAGTIGFSLKGREALVLDEVGSISWFGAALATQSYVNTQLATVTGGGGGGGLSGNVAGIVVVETLPTAGNYIGRLAFYNGDIWIYSNYPIGNGAGQSANPSIAREAGSDNRWVRFRGDLALPTGATRPTTAPEGSLFYQTTDRVIYFFIEGAWRTLASTIIANAPSGLEVLPTLPTAADPTNYQGRTAVVNSQIYIYVDDAWTDLNDYITGGSGAGISTGFTLPVSGEAGELFRLQGTNAGLYIYTGEEWVSVEVYLKSVATARISTLSSLPTNLTSYAAGDIVQVSNVFYILNLARNNWEIFAPGNVLGGGTVTVSLGPEQVETNNIKNFAVTGDKILSNSVPAARLVEASITQRELQANSVIGSKIAAGSVTTAKIGLSAVDELRLAAGAVTTAKIDDGAVTNAKLAGNSISGDKIQVSSLSSLTTNLGQVRTGKLESQDGRMIIDLDLKVIRIEI
jgi:molybdopterin-binding protein